jgi:hypothetical protein
MAFKNHGGKRLTSREKNKSRSSNMIDQNNLFSDSPVKSILTAAAKFHAGERGNRNFYKTRRSQMRRLILMLFVLVFAVALFAQTGPTPAWQYNWGRAGSSVEYQSPYSTTGNIYNPSNYTWNFGTETGKSYMTVTADIEMYMSMTLAATDIYFHIADDGTQFEALVHGTLCSNNGQWLFVSSENDNKDLTKLFFVQDIFGRTAAWFASNQPQNVPSPIPVEWYLKDEQDNDFRLGEYSAGGNNGQLHGVTWLLANGEACCHPFDIKVVIKPAFHQADGRYEMDPLVCVSPVL